MLYYTTKYKPANIKIIIVLDFKNIIKKFNINRRIQDDLGHIQL